MIRCPLVLSSKLPTAEVKPAEEDPAKLIEKIPLVVAPVGNQFAQKQQAAVMEQNVSPVSGKMFLEY